MEELTKAAQVREKSASYSVVDDEGFTMGGQYIPKEVLCTILARLPLRAFIFVCKGWYRLTRDIEFQVIRQQLHDVQHQMDAPFLLWDSTHTDQPYAYDILLRHWLPFPISICYRAARNHPFQVHSSSGGLFLIKYDVNGVKVFSTMNPLTGSQRELPPMLEQPRNFSVLQMVMDDTEKGRYLVLAEGCNQYLADPRIPNIQIYDSKTNSWQMAGNFRPPTPRAFNIDTADFAERFFFRSAAMLNGSLFCLVVTSRTAHVLRHDGMNRWLEVPAKLPFCIAPQAMGSSALINAVMWTPHLFENRGRLMLVGAEFCKYHQRRRPRYGVDELVNLWRQKTVEVVDVDEGVHVWELVEEKMQWVHVHKMPHQLFDPSVKSYEFRTCGDYLHVRPWPGAEEDTMFIANLKTGSWEVFRKPPCNGADVVKDHSFLQQHTMFEPRVHVVA